MPCSNCKFSEAPRDERGQIVFGADVRVCKRMPPNTVVIPTQRGLSINAAWPTVPNGGHCFCYELNLAIGGAVSSIPETQQ